MGRLFSGIGMDVRHVWRALANSKAFTAVAVLSLAIGIGAAAILQQSSGVSSLDPMAVPAPEELALVYWYQPGTQGLSSMNSSGYQDPASGLSCRSNVSYPMYQSMRAAAPAGMQISAFNFFGMSPWRLAISCLMAGGAVADQDYFSVLRPRMHLGGPLGEADNQAGVPLVAVLSHAFWRRAFGGDPAVIGRPIRVNGIPAGSSV